MSQLLRWSLVLGCLSWMTTLAQAQPMRIPEGVVVERDVEYGTGGERPLRMHLISPKEKPATPLPVLVWVHGGGWSGGNRDSGLGRSVPMAAQGYFCASIEYRLSGEATFPAQIEDCKCAIRYLRAHHEKYGIDPERIGVWGSSAGGHLVALLGTSAGVKELEGTGGWQDFSSEVQAVCDLCGPSDFLFWGEDSHPAVRMLLGGTVAEKKDLARLASPVTHVQKKCPPFLIIHGDQDKVVPYQQGEALQKALKAEGVDVTYHLEPGMGHALGGPTINRLIQKFFEKHLQTPSAETDQ